MQAELEKEIRSLFDRYAPEYILEEVKKELYRRGQINHASNYRRAGDYLQQALVTFCDDLPGYRDELDYPSNRYNFKPKW